MTTNRIFSALVATLLVAAPTVDAQTVAYVGATVWDGTGSPPSPNTTIVVENGRIAAVSSEGQVPPGAEIVFLEGKHIIPGLINTHGHVSGLWAPDGVRGDDNKIRADLELFAKYGVTTVNSLGDNDDVIDFARSADPMAAHARLLASGAVISESDPNDAREAAIERADAGADWLKLRVDDNLGVTSKMPWDAVQAVLDVGAERGLPVATHLFYLEDAKRLLEMGTGLVAHSVRNTDVDDEFVTALTESGVCYVPTLTREVSTFVYGERPAFFDEPFFTEFGHEGQIARVSDPDFMENVRGSMSAAAYRVALIQALDNLQVLIEAGAPVAFGTDSGPAGRFPGYFEHMELALMVGAGITPAQALYSATGQAAACLGLDDRGTIEVGKWADFMVLSASPFRDITNTTELEQVYIAGKPIREAPEGS